MTCVKPDWQENTDSLQDNQDNKLENLVKMCDNLTKDSEKMSEICCKVATYSSGSLEIKTVIECTGGRRIKVSDYNNLVLECFLDENDITTLEYKQGDWENNLSKLYEASLYKKPNEQLPAACFPK